MSREIKFEYGFESVNGIVKKVYALSEIPNIKEKCEVWNVLPIVYVRQFVELFDNNGYEFLDGDIFKLTHKEKEYIRVIKWNSNNACFSSASIFNLKKDDYYDIWTDLTFDYLTKFKCEKIGNIYENKDLLPT